MQLGRTVLFSLLTLLTLLFLILSFAVWTSLPGPSDPADRNPGRTLTYAGNGIARADDSRATSALEAPSPPLTGSERDMVAWAHRRFSLVGLDLPDLDVSFYEDTTACEFNDGIYQNHGDHPRVRVCVPDLGTFAFTLERQRTLIHELGGMSKGERNRIRTRVRTSMKVQAKDGRFLGGRPPTATNSLTLANTPTLRKPGSASASTASNLTT